MIRTILTIFILLSALFSTSYAQSVYFFKTKETLELEKWDAMEASKTSVANAIADELSSREKEQKQIDDLQAEIDKKLKAEDYFAADKLNKELEALQATEAKAKDIRKNIESALNSEDFAKAANLKSQLLNVLKTKPVAQSNTNMSSTTSSTSSANQTSVVTTGSGSLQDAFISTKNSSSTSSGLFSSSSGNTDKYGRTESENRMLYNKRRKSGTVLLAVGGALLIPGAVLIGIGAAGLNGDLSAAGVVTGIAGFALLIPGAAILGSSKKYKKRANQLANGTASISPCILNIHSYSGASVNNRAGYGLTLSYQF